MSSVCPLRFSSGRSATKHRSRSFVPVRCISSRGVPVARTRPASMATIQSHLSASSMYAVEMTTLIPGRPARMSSMRVQNCLLESGSTPVVGSSRMSRSGSWTSAPQRPTFCFIPPESFPAGRSANGPSPVARSSSFTVTFRSSADSPKSLRHEVDVVLNAQLQVEILPQPLGHVRDARPDGVSMLHVSDVAAEHDDLPLLHLLRPRDERHQRRLAHAVRADDADHHAAGDVERDAVQRHDLAVAMGDVPNGHHGRPLRRPD